MKRAQRHSFCGKTAFVALERYTGPSIKVLRNTSSIQMTRTKFENWATHQMLNPIWSDSGA